MPHSNRPSSGCTPQAETTSWCSRPVDANTVTGMRLDVPTWKMATT
jgi:hypothetical protein